MRIKSGRFLGIVVVLAFSLNAPCLKASQEGLRIIPTRPKVTQPFLLIRPANHFMADVILFAGGHGRLEEAVQE